MRIPTSIYKTLGLLVLPCFLFAGEVVISDFGGGLNTKDLSATLPDNASPDLLNVNLDPGGKSVKKRQGYGLYKNLPINTSTTAVHGGYHFQDTTGNNIQLWANAEEIASIIAGATPTKVSSITAYATMQCTDSQGSAYCFTTSRNTPVKTDGTSGGTSYQGSIPNGTMATFTPIRLAVAGVSGSINTIYFSKANTFTDFTTGITDPDPFTEVIASPGSRLTHIRYACGKVLWWKDQSFGWLAGDTQSDITIQIVQNDVGTLDNSSAYYNNTVWFRGQDNHIYQYDCANLTRLSRVITPTVEGASRRLSNSWSVGSASAFDAGSYSTSTYYSPYGVWISTTNGNTPDNSFELNTWAINAQGCFQRVGSFDRGVCSTVAPKDGSWIIDAAASAGEAFKVTLIDANSSAVYASTTVPPIASSCTWTQRTLFANITPKTLVKLKLTSEVTDGFEGSVISSTFSFSGSTITFYTISDIVGGTAHNFGIDFFQSGQTTNTAGAYYSAVHNAPNITQWDTFTANDTTNGGSLTYYTRSSTGIFQSLSGNIAWTAQTKNATVAVSTGVYFQARTDFAVTAASQAPTLNQFTFDWFEGSAADKAYIEYFDDHVWVSVSSGTGGTNNRIQRWDLINQAWLLDDIPANGLIVDQARLYIGDPVQGRVFRFGDVSTDNGSNFQAYWKSKDFTGSDPFVQNEFTSYDWMLAVSTGSLTTTYQVNASTSASYSLNLYDATARLIRRSNNMPPGKIGTFYNVKVGNTTDQPWEAFGHRARYTPLNWKPQ